MAQKKNTQIKIAFVSLLAVVFLSCRLFTFSNTPVSKDSTGPLAADTSAPLSPSTPPVPTSLNTTGPYVVFAGSAGIWITNPEGSFPTRITENDPGLADLRRLISPVGDRLALVVATDAGFDLIVVTIPSGEPKTIAHLLSVTQDELINDPTSPGAIASYAIQESDGVAWQPGSGQLLAFTGAMNGPTSDLYLYDTRSEKITQLTDGPSQAIYTNWSPDGEYILHYGVSWVPPFGGAIVGYNRLDSVYAVRASDGQVIDQPKPKGDLANFAGWQDNLHYLTLDTDFESIQTCYATNLRSVNLLTGDGTPLMDYSFSGGSAQSPLNHAILFSASASCSSSPGEGVFLLMPGSTSPIKLLDKIAYESHWLPESEVFQAYPEALFSADGQTRYDPPAYDKSFHPAISKNGYQAWEVIENQQGSVVIKVPGDDWRTILNGSVAQLIWDPLAGNTLLIALQDGTLYSAAYPDFDPRLQGNLGGRVDQAIWLP